MHSSSLQALLFLASLTSATPLPQSTSTPALRKRVIVQDLPRRNRLLRRADGTVNLEFAQKELEHIDAKYTYHNSVYQQNQNSTKLAKRDSALLEAAGTQKEPFDLAAHRRRKRQEVATVSLTDDVEGGVDVSYYSQNLNIGTPAQKFSIDFDTGSADLWVLGPDIAESSAAGNGSPFGSGTGGSRTGTADHATFTPSSSTTNTLSTTTFDITYGTGNIDGTVSQDVVELNGLSVSKQIFGVATTVSSDFINSPFDGLMGIGFSTISQTDGNTWTENLVIDKSLPSNLFSVQLERGSATVSDTATAQVTNSDSGVIIFGAVDSSSYTGSLVYSPVTIEAYWQVAMDGVAYNGQIIPNTAFSAAVDTGTSLVYLPTDVAAAVATAVGASSYRSSSSSVYYAVDCDDIEDINLAFSFAGTLFQFNGADLNGGQISSRSNACMFSIIGANTNDPQGKPLAIVGDAFLKNVVAVFDYSNGVRVGMAAQQGANSTTSPISGNTDTASSASSLTLSILLALPALLMLVI